MNIFAIIKSVFDDFISLFYPDLCLICNKNLLKKEECVCTSCLFQIQKTDCFQNSENRVSKLFWGRVTIEKVASIFEFTKEGGREKLIHMLKYDGNKGVGIFLGKQLAYVIEESPNFNKIDCIVPIPLHPKKERKRGFNQSNVIAKGIHEVLKIKVSTKNLIRIENTDSQTRKKRFNRW